MINQEKLDNLLVHNKKGINGAVKALYDLQEGNLKPIKVSLEFLNELCLGSGILPNLIISFLARPGQGKTYIAQTIRKDLLDDPTRDIGILYFNWEMPWFSILLIELKKRLKKSFKDIIGNKPTDAEISEMKSVADELRDPRFTSVDIALEAKEFEYVCRKYIEENIDREQLYIFIDHIGIGKGKNKLEVMFEIMEVCNRLKLDYPNKLTFFPLSQLNREIEKLWRTKDVNPINLRVTSEYIYGADAIMQYSDIVIASVIPQKAGLEKYCTVNRERYEHLDEHILDEDKNSPKDYVRLKGLNRVYFDILKKRLDDDSPTLYCDVLDQEKEEIISAFATREKDMTDPEDDEIIF
jgi:hypothetical protein